MAVDVGSRKFVEVKRETVPERLRKLAEFRPKAIGLNVNFVATFPDTDGKPVAVDCVALVPWEGHNDFEPGYLEFFKENELPIDFVDFDPVQKESIVYAREVLKVPMITAIHEIMNNGKTKEELEEMFGIPDEDTETPAVISIGKTSRLGKTMLAAILRTQGEEVVGLGGFSGDGVDVYYEAATKDREDPTVEEAVTNMIDCAGKSKNKASRPTAREALDRLSKQLAGGRRPELVICDMPGMRLPDDGGDPRMVSAYDAIRDYSMTCFQLGRVGPDGQPLAEETITPGEVQDYVDCFRSIREQLITIHRKKDENFVNMVKGNYDQWEYGWRTWMRWVAGEANETLRELNEKHTKEKPDQPHGRVILWGGASDKRYDPRTRNWNL